MGYEAKVLCHSCGPFGQELVTFQVRFPRIVLAEVVTHRTCPGAPGEYTEVTYAERTTTEDVSKNSASSRAVPVEKMIAAVLDDPYTPERFSKAGGGMQGSGWLTGADHDAAVKNWLLARDEMVLRARKLLNVGVHKQDVNRLLEPFAWVSQVLTADAGSWNNFFALRCDAAAHPAFQRVARMMFLAKRRSVPESLGYGRWHLPFVPAAERADFVFYPSPHADTPPELPYPIRASAARCAWVSYENHDRDGTPEAHDRTFQRLLGGTPKHGSPLEHQACPMTDDAACGKWRSNLRGWVQARKLVVGERIEEYNPSDEEIATWGIV